MIKENNRRFSFQFIFILLLFLMLVIMSIIIILLGKDVYSTINNDRSVNYEKRVSLSYIATKIRQSDKDKAVRIDSLNNENAVVINEIYDDAAYETWIYFYNNALYEMFTDEGFEFNLEDGMKILDVDSFNIEKINDSLYKFTATANGESTELILNLYSY